MITWRFKQHIRILALCLGMSFLFISFAQADKGPPKVIKTDPEHLSWGVYPIRYIHFWLVGSPTNDIFMPVGVNLDSIELWINGEPKELTIQFQGNEKIWAYTTEIQILPELSEVTSVIMAEDYQGNPMEPYEFKFVTSKLPDQKPPFIYNFLPSHQSIDNDRLPLISCTIEDYDTGVDLNSLVLKVNGLKLPFTFAELEDGYVIYVIPPAPFLYEQWVNVFVSVKDYANNLSEQYWNFRIRSAPPKAPNLFFPSDGALLNYQLENGTIRFVWQIENPEHSFRLRIKPSDGPISHVFDLEPGDYWSTDNFAGFNFTLSYNLWFQFSCKENIDWSVAVIDKKDGVAISPYSNWSSVILAPPNAVVLRSPESGVSFGYFNQPPLFVWDKFSNAESYMLGIAKLDFATGFFQSRYTINFQANVTSFRLSNDVWRSLGSGLFIWAVIATDNNGNLSDFMNYEFNILSPAIINNPLSIH